MSRLTVPRLLVLIVSVMALTGGVVAWAASSGHDADPAPPAATDDVPGVVSLARPITPVAVASTPRSAIEMRIVEPDGARRAVLAFRETRARSGRRVNHICAIPGREAELRKTRLAFGNCRDIDTGDPWSISTGSSSAGPVTIGGLVAEHVTRLTIAGPGGTFLVPTSRSGAFLVVYGRRATGRAVLTATLADGTTRFSRTAIPPSNRPPGAVVAADPGGLPPWFTVASPRDRGPRAGQTCTQVQQEYDIRAEQPRQGGDIFLAPACGDLRKAAVFARTVTIGPTATRNTFGGGPGVPRRTVLAGAVTDAVRAVALVGPSGRRQLPLSATGRAFLAVLPANVTAAQLTLEVTRRDGRVERFVNPVAVNRATSEHPPPRLAARPTLRLRPSGGRRVLIDLTLTDPAKRISVTFLGRQVRLQRVGGSRTRPRYRGTYDGTRGARRALRSGTVQRFTLLVCGEICSTELQRARLR